MKHVSNLALRAILAVSLGVLGVNVGYLKWMEKASQSVMRDQQLAVAFGQNEHSNTPEVFAERLKHADEVHGTYYSRGAVVFYLDRYVLWVSKSQAPAYTRDDLTMGDALNAALREGPLNVVGTFSVEVPPETSVKKAEVVRLFADARGVVAVPK